MRNQENLQYVIAAIIINARSLHKNILGEKKKDKKNQKTKRKKKKKKTRKTKEKNPQKQKKQLQDFRIFYEVLQSCNTNFIDLTKSINTRRFEKLSNAWV